ncbi:MAG TPA: YdeI/OmpD-associated family protein [Terriglobales bacterium]|nr:YdeI/OmpD-associated family protein [Terriglobales bacterium]
MKPTFFATPDRMRAWLDENHQSMAELWVGFYKRNSGRPSITWPESVDAALCYGWIDGVRRSIDALSYMIRFTPRKPGSIWSGINIRKAEALKKSGRMRAAGEWAFAQRSEKKSQIYAYEQRHQAKFDRESAARFKANRSAWGFFESQPPWYRRTSTYWVMTAKREETRQRRLATLIRDSAAGRTIARLTRKK